MTDKKNGREYLGYVLEKLKERITEISLSLVEGQKEIEGMHEYYWENYTEMDQYGYENYDNQQALFRQISANEEQLILKQRFRRMADSPFFGRVDFIYEGEDEPEIFYIGIGNFAEKAGHIPLVYDWRAPVSGLFYDYDKGPASYEAPMGEIHGEVASKWQYKIRNGKMIYEFESDVKIDDEILKAELGSNGEVQLKNIIRTIQKEQNAIIRNTKDRIMVIQGAAGSGKTSIALHRAAYLMYQGLQTKLSANNIMIISPNTIFEQYISNVLPELGEDNVISVVFEDILKMLLKGRKIQSKNDFLEKIIAPSQYKKIYKDSIEFKASKLFGEILDKFIYDIPCQWIEFDDVYYEGTCVVNRQTLQDKILGRTETPLGIKLEQLEDYILELIFGTGKGRGHKAEKNLVKQEIQKFIKIDIFELYKTLFSNESYFFSLLQNNNSSESIKEIREYTKENLEAGCIYYDDAIAMLYLYLKIYGTNEYKNIKQVVIDEAQDYYPLQYEIFGLLFPNAKFTILGDMKQTLAKKEDISFYEEIHKILNKKKSSLIVLNKSFRCTNEILNFSLKFIEQSPQIKSFNRKGDSPEVFIADNSEVFIDKIVEEVKSCQEKGLQSIGLICKTENNSICLYNKIKHKLDIQIIRNGSAAELQGVFIIPVYMSKGLEFDAVLICDADNQNYYDEDDKNLLYVACTRALHRLSLFCEKEVSPLIYATSKHTKLAQTE